MGKNMIDFLEMIPLKKSSLRTGANDENKEELLCKGSKNESYI
jgi:hypothetical protein